MPVLHQDILEYLDKGYGKTEGIPVNDLDLKEIEAVLDSQSAVLKSEAYCTKDGVLHIDVTQRKPLMRFQKGTKGFYYNAALKIIVAGENSITVTTDANATNGKAFAAIYTKSGAITIEDDNVDTTTDKLTITVNGATTGDAGSEWTYGIYSPAGLSVSDIAVDIDVATSDKYAFAIEDFY